MDAKKANLVVVTWDGNAEACACVSFDMPKDFDLLIFNYTGTIAEPISSRFVADYVVSYKTENKGQIFEHLYQYLRQHHISYHYIGIIDDDIFFRVSDFNYMLQIAAIHQLDVFQPSISVDSYFSHRKFVHAPGYIIRNTDWVEIMAPFYKQELFNACAPYFKETISGQGIDCFLMPTIQVLYGKTNTAIIDAAIIRHYRPIRSHQRLYSNGLNNEQEIEKIRQIAIQLVSEKPDLFTYDFKIGILKIGSPIKVASYMYSKKLKKLAHNFSAFLRNLGTR